MWISPVPSAADASSVISTPSTRPEAAPTSGPASRQRVAPPTRLLPGPAEAGDQQQDGDAARDGGPAAELGGGRRLGPERDVEQAGPARHSDRQQQGHGYQPTPTRQRTMRRSSPTIPALPSVRRQHKQRGQEGSEAGDRHRRSRRGACRIHGHQDKAIGQDEERDQWMPFHHVGESRNTAPAGGPVELRVRLREPLRSADPVARARTGRPRYAERTPSLV